MSNFRKRGEAGFPGGKRVLCEPQFPVRPVSGQALESLGRGRREGRGIGATAF